MKNLSKSQQSKEYLDNISGKKSKSISKSIQQKLDKAGREANKKISINNAIYNQSNAHSNEAIVRITLAEKFVVSLETRKNPHLRDCVSLNEKYGTIKDYFEYQEQRDLENYKKFINSSAYDDIKETESEIEKTLTLTNLRKISSMHDD